MRSNAEEVHVLFAIIKKMPKIQQKASELPFKRATDNNLPTKYEFIMWRRYENVKKM